jgi:antitoxin component YwqK of YwqJK toxin-antitoxin module
MSRYFIPVCLCAVALSACSTHKYVASKYPNGKPEVVLYLKGKGEQAVKVMEKVYHPNGNLDYVGRFQDGKEQGEWNYFYEDGTRKYTEHWNQGLEDGVQIEYSPDGQVYLEKYYEKGKLVRTVDKSKEP